jgi:hypothetical protein
MRRLPKTTYIDIQVDEWQVAQGKADSVGVAGAWRGAEDGPTLADLLAALPPGSDFIPLRLADRRTELALEAWKHLRFGKGPPIFEAARQDYDAWASGPTDRLAEGRERLTKMVLFHLGEQSAVTRLAAPLMRPFARIGAVMGHP